MKRLFPHLLAALSLLAIAVIALAQDSAPVSSAPSGAQPASGKVQLRFVVWDGDESSKVLKREIQRFEERYPQIDVKFETVAYDGYFDKLLAQYAADVAPDVAMMNPEMFQRFARRGALVELNQFYDVVPGFDINEYYKEIVDAHSLDGKLYVLPRDIAPISIIYYNKDFFDRRGVPYPSPDWTWDFKVRPELKNKDFLWVMQQLTYKDEKGQRYWGYAPGWQGLLTDMFYLSTGGRIADDYKNPTKITYDDPRVVKAFQFSADLALKERFMPSGQEMTSGMATNARQLFTQQRVAMFHSGIWETPELRKEIVEGKPGYFRWDIAIAPAYQDGTRAYPTGGSGYCIMSRTRHPRESWLLAQWMAGENGMAAMAKAGIAQPAIRSLAQREPWIPGPNTPKDQQVPANRIITDQSVEHVVFSPSGINWTEVNNLAIQPHALVYDGVSTADKELPRGNKIAQGRLDTLLKEETLPKFDWRLGGLVGVLIAAAIVFWVYKPEFGKRRTLKERRENRMAYLFLLPWVLGMILFTAGPMILSLLMSFADWDIIQPARWRGVGNYREAFMIDPSFWVSLKVTMIYTLVAVPLGLVASLALALLLNTKVKGMPLWRTCYYIPSIASGVASALIWRKVFQSEGGILNTVIYGADGHGNFLGLASLLAPVASPQTGMVNWLGSESTALGSLILMSVWGAGGGMVILLAGLQGVPNFYYEAATLDGASPWRRFLNVTLPMISPTLFFSLVTGFIGSFQVFTQALLMTSGGPNNATLFFMLHLYNQAFRGLRMGYASALAWVLFFVILVFTVIQLRASKWVYYEGAK